MKGMHPKKAIFISAGQDLTKRQIKRPSFSQSSSTKPQIANHNNTPSNSAQVNRTQLVIPNHRRLSQAYYNSNNKPTSLTGINDEFMYMRKENHLNTQFNIRKNKLKEITKENKSIHKKINSQKSLYSSIDLRKSFDETKEIKKRLSQSKLSQRLGSSRSSSRSNTSQNQKHRLGNKKPVRIEIKASDINKAERMDLKSFEGLFTSNIRTAKNNNSYKDDKESIITNSFRKNEIYVRPPKISINKKEPISEIQGPAYGGLLHRIVEQMSNAKDRNASKKKGSYFKQPSKNSKNHYF